ncbi:MAG: hypothetical protein V4581_16785 [Bacteroidota bacterium]
MTLREKFDVLMGLHGYNLKTIAIRLDLTYKVLSRNVVENKFTSEMAYALKREFPDIDLNWWFEEEPNRPMLLEEPNLTYGNPQASINKIKELLSGLEKHFGNE